MSAKAKALKTLYMANLIAIWGVRRAVSDGIITQNEFKQITGLEY